MNQQNGKQTIKIEVWSDVSCPFCYIGKRHLEAAITQLGKSSLIETEWKSFELDANIPANGASKKLSAYIAEKYRISEEQALKMFDNVAEMAQRAGLEFHFDTTVVANTFKAHRLLQFAKTKGCAEKAEEILFNAYFTEGKNLGDDATLTLLGAKMELSAEEVAEALSNDEYAYRVSQDILEARNNAVQGVPFFIIDGKYAISGAQQVDVFTETIQKSLSDKGLLAANASNGPTCGPGCDCN